MRHHQLVLWGSDFTRSQRRKSWNSRYNSAAGSNSRREDGVFEPLSPLVATSRLSPVDPEQERKSGCIDLRLHGTWREAMSERSGLTWPSRSRFPVSVIS